jgi:single-strand DNA-binding protein
MNNCLLLAEIVQAPQLRYTSDNQTPVAEFVVQFPGLRDDDPPAQMKVIGWGNLAQDIQTGYQAGQKVLLEGRLNMNLIDRPEGFREKQAEMTISRIYDVNTLGTMAMAQAIPANRVASPAVASPDAASSAPPMGTTANPPAPAAAPDNPSYDDIPF